MEVWKPIPGYEGIYEASSFGRIRSVDRIDPAGRRQSGKVRKPYCGKRGYYVVTMRKDRKCHLKSVHILVALVFIGPPPAPLGIGINDIQVNHKDGDKRNNRLDNLEYCTHAENTAHAYDIGLHDGSLQGERNGRSRLTSEQVQEVRTLYATGQHSIPQLGRRFGVGKSTIGYIVQGATWKHL